MKIMMFRLLLLTTAVAAQETMMPSDMPSDVPSMVPSSPPAAESSLPTIVVTGFPVCPLCPDGSMVGAPDKPLPPPYNFTCGQAQGAGLAGAIDPTNCGLLQEFGPDLCECPTPEPTASPVQSIVPPPSTGECTTSSCTLVPTWGGISNFITAAESGDMLCLCGRIYESGFCGGAATLATDKDITLECAPSQICSFNCPLPAFEVNAGSLTLTGTDSNFIFTGGDTYSRVVVNENGSFIASSIMFEDTSCFAQPDSSQTGTGRRMQGTFGRGGGIETHGMTTVTDSTFTNCHATSNGGAVYMASGSATFRGCTFRDNEAFSGGAIYAEDGSLTVENSAFEDNTSTSTNLDPDVVTEPAVALEACGNAAGNPELSGGCSGAAAIFKASSTILAVGFAAMALFA